MWIIQPLVLSIIQGITEFLPVSSSGHLILTRELLGWADQGLAFDAFIHLGTVLAIVIYFRKDLLQIVKDFIKNSGENKRKLGSIIIVSMIPATVLGLLFNSAIESSLRSSSVVIVNLFFWGVILIVAELFIRRKKTSRSLRQLKMSDGIIIGCAQALALLPGTSRSGVTISAAIFSNISRETAVKFSFLMGVPVILGAGLLSFVDLFGNFSNQSIDWASLIVALFFSFISGLLAINILLKLVDKQGLIYFGIYRIIIAILLAIMYF